MPLANHGALLSELIGASVVHAGAREPAVHVSGELETLHAGRPSPVLVPRRPYLQAAGGRLVSAGRGERQGERRAGKEGAALGPALGRGAEVGQRAKAHSGAQAHHFFAHEYGESLLEHQPLHL